ncbi:MAG: hypothetical protein GY862_34930 [Gammaproteobacteria bacterium]|nr:hypothetical protein [Gammaproteobacteria bacterium]
MVKAGFVVEGDCEKLLLESSSFKSWARKNGIQVCSPVINARGGGNLCPQQISAFVEQAAIHPNCPSARYFLCKLKELAELNG